MLPPSSNWGWSSARSTGIVVLLSWTVVGRELAAHGVGGRVGCRGPRGPNARAFARRGSRQGRRREPPGCAPCSRSLQLAVEAARRAGADVADARVGTDESESITVRDERWKASTAPSRRGRDPRARRRTLGLRRDGAPRRSRDRPDRRARRPDRARGRRASRASRCALAGRAGDRDLAHPRGARTRSRCRSKRRSRCCCEPPAIAIGQPGVTYSEAFLDLFRRTTFFACSEGAAIEQIDHPRRRRACRRPRSATTTSSALLSRTRSGGTIGPRGRSTSSRCSSSRRGGARRPRGGRAAARRRSVRARSRRSCSTRTRWSSRSTSRSGTRPSSTACSGWSSPSPAARS